MVHDNYPILNELISSFKKELSEVKARIRENDLLIKEEEACVKAIEGIESDDFKVFYPRKQNTPLQADQIAKSRLRIVDYEEKNKKLDEIKTSLENRICQLESVQKFEAQNITVTSLQEEDRKRIARDLHDDSLQNLIHLIHKLEICAVYVDQDPVKAKLELSLISKNLKEIISDIRNTIFDLRPMTFDDLGLKPALQRLLDKINYDKKFEILSSIDDVSCENDLTLSCIYRVVKESLTNIIKHAEASKIVFRCKEADRICMIDIEDNGIGFCEEKKEDKEKHFGLSLMREQVEMLNGKFQITSSKGNGTKIHMEIPLIN